jgi:hypothetical protein
MYKKILFLLILTLTLFIQFNNNVEALQFTDLVTFNVGFTPVKEFIQNSLDPDDPTINIEGTNVMLISSCVLLRDDTSILSVRPTTELRPQILGVTYENANGYFSEIRYFENTDCTNPLQSGTSLTNYNSNHSLQNRSFFANNPDGAYSSKAYVFDTNTPFKGFDINNPIQARAFRMVHATTIPFSNLDPFYQISGNATGALITVNTSTRFSFELPNRVDFIIENTIISKYYLDRLPAFPPTPTKTNHTFLYYLDLEGNEVKDFRNYYKDLVIDRVYTLRAEFEKDFSYGQPSSTFTPPAINNPISVILFNLGYYNITGLVFIYTLLILISSVALYKYNMPSFVILISNILITAVFLFLGYLPFFVSVIMIMLFILLILGINKGGLFSE